MSESKELFVHDPALIDQLAGPLKKLLDVELAEGNKVVEATRGWPTPDGIMVMLVNEFGPSRKVAEEMGITFVDVNDRHWWRAEYQLGLHVLACRFSD